MKKHNKSLPRRTFLKSSAAVGALIVAPAACGTRGNKSEDNDAGQSDGPMIDGAMADGPLAKDAQDLIASADGPFSDFIEPTCGEITESNIEGPFYTPDSPERINLRDANMPGEKLHLTGTVVDTTCQPIPGAMLDFWQANAAGEYDNEGFILRGHQFADGAGQFTLDTIVPGHYLNGATFRPAHIHVKVSGDGFPLLTTQLYFEDDPYNDIDAFIRESLIMPISTEADGTKSVEFQFVLAALS